MCKDLLQEALSRHASLKRRAERYMNFHKADAEDALQDLYLELLRARPKEKINSLESYVSTSSRFVFIQAMKKRTLWASRKVEMPDDLPSSLDISEAELANLLEWALGSFHGKRREVLRLSVEGWKDSEIAEKLKLSKQAIKVYTWDMRRKLRDLYKSQINGRIPTLG